MPFCLETARLRLRELNESDAQAMFTLNADPDVMRHTGDVPFVSLNEAKRFLKNYTDYKINGFGRWAVQRKSDNEILGWCGLKRHQNGMVDLGFRLMKKYWNAGYATEAAKACVAFGFEELKLTEIIGRAEPENTASVIVLKKCGMTFSHTAFDDLHDQKEIVIYKITNEDFSRH